MGTNLLILIGICICHAQPTHLHTLHCDSHCSPTLHCYSCGNGIQTREKSFGGSTWKTYISWKQWSALLNWCAGDSEIEVNPVAPIFAQYLQLGDSFQSLNLCYPRENIWHVLNHSLSLKVNTVWFCCGMATEHWLIFWQWWCTYLQNIFLLVVCHFVQQ